MDESWANTAARFLKSAVSSQTHPLPCHTHTQAEPISVVTCSSRVNCLQLFFLSFSPPVISRAARGGWHSAECRRLFLPLHFQDDGVLGRIYRQQRLFFKVFRVELKWGEGGGNAFFLARLREQSLTEKKVCERRPRLTSSSSAAAAESYDSLIKESLSARIHHCQTPQPVSEYQSAHHGGPPSRTPNAPWLNWWRMTPKREIPMSTFIHPPPASPSTRPDHPRGRRRGVEDRIAHSARSFFFPFPPLREGRGKSVHLKLQHTHIINTHLPTAWEKSPPHRYSFYRVSRNDRLKVVAH